MTKAVACPDATIIEKFTLGQLPPDQIESVGAHLTGCPACLKRLEALPVRDTLIDALAQSTAGNVAPPVVEQLIAKLKAIRLSADTPNKKEDTVGLPGLAAALPEDLVGVLAPSQGEGEIGRLGSYRVLKVLGAGGMGAVFLAEDTQLDRQVALKVVKPAVAANPSAKQRFLREAKACAALKSEHVITIHQVGEDRGIPFIAMEFLEGLPLDKLLESGRKLTVPQILRIGREVAKGLAAAHDKGLIHRDIKPGNIWLDKHSGKAKILDFGLARTDAEDVHLTASGAIVGTPAYMAPEQARSEKVDGRCDLYSLGCVLYRMCTGDIPFKGQTTMAILLALAMEKHKPVRAINPAIPMALADLIDQLLAKEPKDRPASAKDVIKALQAIESALSGASSAKLSAPAAAPIAAPVAPAANPFADLTEAGPQLVVPPKAAPSKPKPATPKSATPKPARTEPRPPAIPKPKVRPADRGPSNRRWLQIGGAGLAAAVVLAGVIIIIKNKDGTENRVEVAGNDNVKVEGNKVTITPGPPKPGTPILPPLPLPAGASPFDALQRENIPPEVLRDAGGGDPAQAPADLVAVFGDSRLRSWSGQTGAYGVTTGAVSPDGKLLATPDNGYLRLWNLETGRLLHSFPGRFSTTGTVLFSSDSKRLAADRYGPALVWDTDTGRELLKRESGNTYNSPAFSPDGKRLACPGPQNVVQQWDIDSGQPAGEFKGHTAQVMSLAYSPDGKLLASGSGGGDAAKTAGEVIIWDLTTGQPLHTFPEAAKTVRLQFTPDSTRLVCFLPETAVRVRDVKTGMETSVLRGVVGWQMALSSDGTQLVTQARDNAKPARWGKWNPSQADSRFEPLTSVSPGALLGFNASNGQLACATGPGKVECHDLSTGKQVVLFDGVFGSIRNLDVTPDGQRVFAVSGGTEALRSWDVSSGQEIVGPRPLPGGVLVSALSRDGSTLALCFGDKAAIKDAATGKEVATFPIPGMDFTYGALPALSPDGKRLLTSKRTGDIRSGQVWDTVAAKEIFVLPGHKDVISRVAYSPDGTRMATYSVDGDLKIWDAATGKEQHTITTGFKGTGGLTFSPDGAWVGLAARKWTGVWDAASGMKRWEIEFPNHVSIAVDLSSIAFSPDGRQLVVGNKGGPFGVYSFDAATGKKLREWTCPGQVTCVAYAADGRHILTGNGNGTVYVLRLAQPPAAEVKSVLPPQPLAGASPFDRLKREDIPAAIANMAGQPEELVGVFGEPLKDNRVVLLHVTPDSQKLVTATRSEDGTATTSIWDFATGHKVSEVKLGAGYGSPSLTNDGQRILVGSTKLTIADTATGQSLGTISLKGEGTNWERVISPDGRRVATTLQHGPKNTLKVLDSADGKVLFTQDSPGLIEGPLFSPDNKLLAVSMQQQGDIAARVWVIDVETGKELFAIEKSKALAFSPDSARIALFTGGICVIHDAKSGAEIMKVGFKVPVDRAAFSPDKKWLATKYIREVNLFEADTGKHLRRLTLPISGLALTFAPDGRHLLTGNGDGTVYVLRLAPPPVP